MLILAISPFQDGLRNNRRVSESVKYNKFEVFYYSWRIKILEFGKDNVFVRNKW